METNQNRQMKYEEAIGQLEKIVRQMENNELDVDQLSEQLKRAQQLIQFCRDKLTKTDEEIRQILEEGVAKA
ncbi:MAG: exodeoxyribonuclease VII small subunit [Prevotella sp.]|nr:exodeoxyribonuclease VII small subunit [Prevotella sp.]MDY5656406.1 exodeoxyribonuclease VII small subunit [Prevotella sp.]